MLIRKYKEQYHWLACLFGHACFDATLAAKAKRCRKCIDNWHHSPTKTLSRAISHIYINTASKDTTWPICLVCKQFNFCTSMQNSLQGHTLIQTLFLSFSNNYNCQKYTAWNMVNLCEKLLFLHQLTTIWQRIVHGITMKAHNMGRTCSALVVFMVILWTICCHIMG